MKITRRHLRRLVESILNEQDDNIIIDEYSEIATGAVVYRIADGPLNVEIKNAKSGFVLNSENKFSVDDQESKPSMGAPYVHNPPVRKRYEQVITDESEFQISGSPGQIIKIDVMQRKIG